MEELFLIAVALVGLAIGVGLFFWGIVMILKALKGLMGE